MVSRLQDDEKAFLKGSLLLHQICCYTAQDTVRDVITWFVASSHSNTSSNNSNNNTKSGSSSSSCSTMSSPPIEAAAKQELLIDKHEKQDSIEKIEISVKEEVVKEEKEEEEEEIEKEPKIIKKNKTTKSQESFVNNTSQHTINNSNSSGSTSFSKHNKQNSKSKLNRKKENSKSKLSKASKKSASSYFVRATKHIIVKTFGGVTSKNKLVSNSEPSTTATTMMTEHKRKFDLMDVDLAEDGDTDLEDATSRDEEEEGHVDTDLVDADLEDAVIREEEEEGHDHDSHNLSTLKTTTIGIQLKKNEDDDPGNISIELTRTFDSVDVDLAEDVDTDLVDTVDDGDGDGDGDGDDPWHMTVENVITEIIKEQQEQDQDQDQEHKSVVGSEDIASFLVSCPFLTSVLLSLLIVEIENQEDVSRSTSMDDIPPPPPPPPERHSIHYSVLLPTDNDGEAPPLPIRKTIKYWEEKSLNDSISSNASFFDIPLPPTTGRLSASQLYLFEDDDDDKRNMGPIDSNESYDDIHVEELRHETSLDNGYKNLPRMSAITHDSVTSLNTLPSALSTSKSSGERRSTRHTRRSLRKSGGSSIHHSSDQRTMIIVILCITFGISFVDDIFNYCETQSILHVHDIPSFFNNLIVDDNNKDKNTNNTFLVNDDESSSSSRSSTLMKRKQIHQQQRQQYWDEHIVSTFL